MYRPLVVSVFSVISLMNELVLCLRDEYKSCDSIQIQEVKQKQKQKQNKRKKERKEKKKKFYIPINIDNKSELLLLSWYKLVQLLHSYQNLVFRN